MKKKLLLFVLAALSTTLNGCSCSSQIYHSYKGQEPSLSSSFVSSSYKETPPASTAFCITFGSTSSVSSSSSSSMYIPHDGEPLAYYINSASGENVSYRYMLPQLSEELYRDYDLSVLNLLNQIGNYSTVSGVRGGTLTSDESSLYLRYEYQRNSDVCTMTLTNKRYLVASISLLNYHQAESVFLLSEETYNMLVTKLKEKCEAVTEDVNKIIATEVTEAISANNFFSHIKSMTSGTITVQLDKEYWRLDSSVPNKLEYTNGGKPQYLSSLTDESYDSAGQDLVLHYTTPEKTYLSITYDGVLYLKIVDLKNYGPVIYTEMKYPIQYFYYDHIAYSIFYLHTRVLDSFRVSLNKYFSRW